MDTEIETTVAVVGAGPGGCLLAYLLARSGIETTLIERHATLDREFRGYLFQPLALDVFEQLGLLDEVLALDHERVSRPEVVIYGRPYRTIDFEALGGGHDYALLMEQPPLLELLVERAAEFPNFEYHDRLPARDLLYEGGRVAGVLATNRRTGDAVRIRSRVVVGADGRYSTVRASAGIDPGRLASKLDLLWFKLPADAVGETAQGRYDDGGLLLYFGLGGEAAQAGWFIPRGSYADLRGRGIEAFRERISTVDPGLDGVLPDALGSFDDCTLLRIEPGMGERWVDGGLLLLGDAAHIASPVGGQGNALAIADAVVAHETVARALSLDPGDGPLPACALGRYESRRRPAVERVVETQRRLERALTALVLHGERVPRPIRRPALRTFFSVAPRSPLAERTAELLAFGPDPVRVDDSWFEREAPTQF
ncbi:FAD-dependent oxidoreductase [Halalkalicoccus sp. NIPERK01]|uniref:FAD-dependent oxidoreductase n=1 Tax=Halalkalicoccus sp. NIPERK01 TaxID=3053469 RepID=UPI00256F64F1|nr:FAD-dependent oxidoreductase [Halalkalicoccus sp. NIPERK01]MDL5360436.1 FAD-dependent oxidoreductase [Halalkalicoccus sp. NIPERK01]